MRDHRAIHIDIGVSVEHLELDGHLLPLLAPDSLWMLVLEDEPTPIQSHPVILLVRHLLQKHSAHVIVMQTGVSPGIVTSRHAGVRRCRVVVWVVCWLGVHWVVAVSVVHGQITGIGQGHSYPITCLIEFTPIRLSARPRLLGHVGAVLSLRRCGHDQTEQNSAQEKEAALCRAA